MSGELVPGHKDEEGTPDDGAGVAGRENDPSRPSPTRRHPTKVLIDLNPTHSPACEPSCRGMRELMEKDGNEFDWGKDG